ncbi:hypothetical protein LAZ67_2000790 [Cordylochernes scorpioides]|uniref:DDE-1 domain-containing protein n=1 Tax=Cordylochernes scorpioides TaxID=51811 RepID=A0ABY6K3Y1_9ARAC|nr:hypothetical protein LAZ67_2000790 [Cordylochernes scorpioides]
MLTVAYGEATLDRSNVYRWYKMFSEGREDVNDEGRAGRPSTSTTDEKINEVEKMILANRRITVREVSEDLNISIGSCHSIFINDLGMRRVAAKFVPKFLNCNQKQHRMNIANEILDSVRDDPNLLQRVITGDEAWVYGYDVETKAQSSQWKLPHKPRPKKARQVRSNVKVLLTVFFDCRGVVHHEFLPQGRTVNKEYYLQVMRNLREAIRQKRPDLWKNKNWLLHHDNVPAHTSLLVRDFLAKNNTLMMPQPPYSPILLRNRIIFQLIPDRTLAHKDESCRGVKRMKQRITVLLCCNSTGTDKRRLLIIGKSAKPRCFRNFSPHFYCTYTSNSKAWMTSSIFQEWLLQFNKQLVSEGRRILLFGIIKSFKAQYRKLQLQKMVELADAHLPTELRLDYAVRYFEPLKYGNLLDRIRDIFAITPENLMTERKFQLVDDSQEAEMKLTDDKFLVSTVTAKEELGEDDDATVTQRLPSLNQVVPLYCKDIRLCWQEWVKNGRMQHQDDSGQPREATEQEDRAIDRMAVAVSDSMLSISQCVTGTQMPKMTIMIERAKSKRSPTVIMLTPHTCTPTSQLGTALNGDIVFSD